MTIFSSIHIPARLYTHSHLIGQCVSGSSGDIEINFNNNDKKKKRCCCASLGVYQCKLHSATALAHTYFAQNNLHMNISCDDDDKSMNYLFTEIYSYFLFFFFC